jgi:uncharacterized protein YcgI (DUF1989 family)
MRRSDIQRQYFFKDGISAPAQYVQMREDMDVTALIAHFPQLDDL